MSVVSLAEPNILNTKPVEGACDVIAIDPGIENVGFVYVRVYADGVVQVVAHRTCPLIPEQIENDSMSIQRAVKRYWTREVLSAINFRLHSDNENFKKAPPLFILIENQFVMPGRQFHIGLKLKIVESCLVSWALMDAPNTVVHLMMPIQVKAALKLTESKRNVSTIRRDQFIKLYQSGFRHKWESDAPSVHTSDCFLMIVCFMRHVIEWQNLPREFSNLGDSSPKRYGLPDFPTALSSPATSGSSAQASPSKEEASRPVPEFDDEDAPLDVSGAGVLGAEQADED